MAKQTKIEIAREALNSYNKLFAEIYENSSALLSNVEILNIINKNKTNILKSPRISKDLMRFIFGQNITDSTIIKELEEAISNNNTDSFNYLLSNEPINFDLFTDKICRNKSSSIWLLKQKPHLKQSVIGKPKWLTILNEIDNEKYINLFYSTNDKVSRKINRQIRNIFRTTIKSADDVSEDIDKVVNTLSSILKEEYKMALNEMIIKDIIV